MANEVPKSLKDGVLTTTELAWYSAPTKVIIHQLILTCYDTVQRQVTVKLSFKQPNGSQGAGRRIRNNARMEPGDTLFVFCEPLELEQSDQILMSADANSVIDFVLTGREYEQGT